MDFTEWLSSTRDLQRDTFGLDPAALEDEDLSSYIRWNSLAAHDELSEMLGEVYWKPWAVEAGFKSRDAFVEEAVDALHFIANMLVAARCDGKELSMRYRNKQSVNRERQRRDEGYRHGSG